MGSEAPTLHAAWSATPAGAHALQYCSDASPGIWLTPTATYEMAARFTPVTLAPYVGGKVTKVLFHSANKSCTIRVYASGTATAPGTVLYEVAVPAPAFSGWHTVDIPAAQQPTVGTGDLWISYERVYTGDLGLGSEGRTDQGMNGGWYRSNGGEWIQGYDDVWKLKLEIATP